MNDESEFVEFKPSLSQVRNIIETVSAFSNTKGGRIEIGRKDDGTIVGVSVGKDTIEKLASEIKQNTDPHVYPSIQVREVDGKTMIVIEVREGHAKPVLAFGRAFKRVGKTNQRLEYEEIRKLAMKTSKLCWDELVCEGAASEDIDEDRVRWFLRRAKDERNFDVSPETPVDEALERLNLMKSGQLTNAALLLFGKRPQRFFPQAETRCARFKGTEPVEFIDMKVFAGDVIGQRDNAIEFVKEHIELHAEIAGAERIETWEYPIGAVREAVTNAICHRDYELSANVQVRIFDDRIEIWGCGPLPEPLRLEDLKREHPSILRNRLVGSCFFLIRFVEEWGTGTNRMIRECVDRGLPEPVFEELSGSLVITLRKGMTEEFLRGMGLNERQVRAMGYLKEHGEIDRKTYCSLCNVGKTVAHEELADMVDKKLIEMVGKGRSVRYILRK